MSDEPSRWLVENLDAIPRGRRVLDVASGRGRHALFVAARGWRVHAVDRNAEVFVALHQMAGPFQSMLTTEVIDLEAGTVSLGNRAYGAVLVFNYLHRPLMPAIVEAIEPGGVLIYETFTVGQAARGHPKNPAFLLGDGELPGLVAPLEVVRAREGERDGKLLAAIVATRR